MLKKLTLNKLEKGILIMFLVFVLFFISVELYQDNQRQKEVAGLSDELKLKAPKDKIVDYQERMGPNNEPIIVYTYITDQKVEPESYQGFPEDQSKMTNNTRFYRKPDPAPDTTSDPDYILYKQEHVAKIYAGQPFAKDGDEWHFTETASTTKTAFLNQVKPTLVEKAKGLLGQPVFAATCVAGDVCYSGAGDGTAYRDTEYLYSTCESWADARSASAGHGADYTNSEFSGPLVTSGASPLTLPGVCGEASFTMYRSFFPIDTSGIDDGATISSAVLKIKEQSYYSGTNDSYDYITVTQASQANTGSLVADDYDQVGTTELIDSGQRKEINGTNFPGNTYISFTLNSTGISAISKTGYTKFGVREGHDFSNNVPVDYEVWGVLFSSSEATGTGSDPYLEVSTSAVVSAQNKIKINGGALKINGGKLRIN